MAKPTILILIVALSSCRILRAADADLPPSLVLVPLAIDVKSSTDGFRHDGCTNLDYMVQERYPGKATLTLNPKRFSHMIGLVKIPYTSDGHAAHLMLHVQSGSGVISRTSAELPRMFAKNIDIAKMAASQAISSGTSALISEPFTFRDGTVPLVSLKNIAVHLGPCLPVTKRPILSN